MGIDFCGCSLFIYGGGIMDKYTKILEALEKEMKLAVEDNLKIRKEQAIKDGRLVA